MTSRRGGDSAAAVGDDRLGGYLASRHLIDLGHQRLALIAGPAYASSALGRRAGYEDLSVVGYNDIRLASRLALPLTTVRVPFDTIAAAAVDQLIDRTAGTPAGTRTFAPTLIPRRTTVRARVTPA
ncbi:substrate-binding domain-containing protein [Streptomyces sp. NPDC007983]|uniref:substrate-binding domain-containing protein n=1 Tax=Streptomyces sp. NPDC007983 TaxID=3364800 RepID=UPI0036F18868